MKGPQKTKKLFSFSISYLQSKFSIFLTSVPVPMTPLVRRALSSSMFSLVTVNAPTADILDFVLGQLLASLQILAPMSLFYKFYP